MNSMDDTKPGPLDEYFAEYLRALDGGASPGELSELRQRQRERLRAEYASDPAHAAELDARLREFFEDHARMHDLAGAFRAAPDVTIAHAGTGGSDERRDCIGAIIGNYEIVRQIGEGGMGVVHEARDRQLKRLVAIKRLLDGTPERRARFDREARAMAALRHENIIQIHEVGEHQGNPYFVMELAEGGSLAGYLRSLGLPNWGDCPAPMSQADMLRIRTILLKERIGQSVRFLLTVSGAMAYAHGKGVLHRDLKPGNILLQNEPGQGANLRSPLIADFGLAKILGDHPALGVTRPDTVLGGTVFYAAPEQFEGGIPVDARADIYSLGALLYELLTGAPPLQAAYSDRPKLGRVLEIKRTEPPPPHEMDDRVPLDLSAICARCLRVEPGRRYECAQELVDELQRWLDGKPILTRHQSVLEKWQSWYRNEPRTAWLWTVSVTAFLLVVTAAIGWSAVGWQAAQRRYEIAQQEIDSERQRRQQQDRIAAEARKAMDRAIQLKGEARNVPFDVAKLQSALLAAHEAATIVKAGEAGETLRQNVGELVHGLQREMADVRLLSALDKARLHKMQLLIEPGRDRPGEGWLSEGHFIYHEAAQGKYLAAFQEYGLDLDGMKEDEIVRALRHRSERVRQEAALALMELAVLRGGLMAAKRPFGKSPLKNPADQPWIRFFAIAGQIDDHPWRDALRDTLLETNWIWFGRGLERRSISAGEMELPVSHLCFLAEVRGAVGQNPAAIALLRQAEKRLPSDALICCYLAFLESRKAKPAWSDVASWYRAAVAMQPDAAVIRNNLGVACHHLQKHADALTHFKAAADLAPNFPVAWYNLGVTLHQLNQVQQAADAWNKAIQLDQKFAQAQQNLATVLGGVGKLDEALKLFEASLQADGKNAITHYNYGNLLLNMHDLTGAGQHYRRAIELKEDFAWAHCDLGLTLQAMGNFTEALKHMEHGHKLMIASGDHQQERVAKRIGHCKRLAEFDGRLGKLVAGEETPENTDDCLTAAELAAIREEHATAVRLYRAARGKQNSSSEDGRLFSAACSAALAGGGEGRGTTKNLGEMERARLRGQAMDWLRAELERVRRSAGDGKLRCWGRDPRLAWVRDEAHLLLLPERERAEWRAFWAEVERAGNASDPRK